MDGVESLQKEIPQKIKFISAGQLCAAPPRTDWIVKDYLNKNSMSTLFGEPGSMKTFAAIDQGLCVATNTEWHGQEIRQSGPVFYIAGEGIHGIRRRLKAWSIAHEIPLDDVPFFVSDRPAQFLNKESALDVVAGFEGLKEEHGDPVLVIVDTLNRNFGSGDENSTEDMTRFISTIDEHIRIPYECAVLIVHHTGLTNTNRTRGSSALRGALDWEYMLKKNSETINLSCTKSKDYENPPNMTFKPEIITIDDWNDPEENEPMTSLVLRSTTTAQGQRTLTGANKIAYDALLSCGNENVHIDTWRDAAYSMKISPANTPESNKKAFQRAVEGLVKGGYVTKQADHYFPNRDI